MKISNEVKIAILAIVASILLYFGFNFLKGTNILSNQNTYTVVYDNVNGLVPGNQVLLNGLKIGMVESAEFMEDKSHRIKVLLSVDGDVKIPRNAIAQIRAADLLGDMEINMNLSRTSASPDSYRDENLVQDGEQLQGELELGMMETVTKELMPVTGRVEELMTSMDSLLIVINSIVATGQIQNTLNSVEQTVIGLQKTSEVLDKILLAESQTFMNIMENVGALTDNLNKSTEKLDRILINGEKISNEIAATDFQKISGDISSTIENANKTIGTLDKTLDQVNTGDGSLSLLLKDPKLYNNLEKTSANLESLLSDLKQNPKRYVQFSLIQRKDKNKDKKNNEDEEGN